MPKRVWPLLVSQAWAPRWQALFWLQQGLPRPTKPMTWRAQTRRFEPEPVWAFARQQPWVLEALALLWAWLLVLVLVQRWRLPPRVWQSAEVRVWSQVWGLLALVPLAQQEPPQAWVWFWPRVRDYLPAVLGLPVHAKGCRQRLWALLQRSRRQVFGWLARREYLLRLQLRCRSDWPLGVWTVHCPRHSKPTQQCQWRPRSRPQASTAVSRPICVWAWHRRLQGC